LSATLGSLSLGSYQCPEALKDSVEAGKMVGMNLSGTGVWGVASMFGFLTFMAVSTAQMVEDVAESRDMMVARVSGTSLGRANTGTLTS
jgi:hypothetical protein